MDKMTCMTEGEMALHSLLPSFVPGVDYPTQPQYNQEDELSSKHHDLPQRIAAFNRASDNLASPSGIVHSNCEVRWSSGYGRYLVTLRDVSAGEVLIQETPLIVAPKVGSEPSCLSCLKSLHHDWIGCRGCGGPVCSHECSGNRHSDTECTFLMRMGLKEAPHIDVLIKELNILLGPLRLLLVMQDSLSAKEIVFGLQNHMEERRKLPIGKFVEEHISSALQCRLGLNLSSEIVHRLCGVLDTNAFDVNLDNVGRGRAVCAAAAMMNHSCVPNAQWWYWKGKLIVRAAVDIGKDSPVFINYTQTLWGTWARATHLSNCKMFMCNCKRCLDPTELGSHLSSICCQGCQGVMEPPSDPSSTWHCTACNRTVAPVMVDTMLQAGATALARLPEEDPETITIIISRLSRVLGPNHYIVAQAKHCFLQTVAESHLTEVSTEHLKLAVVMAQELVALLDRIGPGLTRLRGVLLYYHTAASTELLRREGDATPHAVQALIKQSKEADRILQYDHLLAQVKALTAQLRTFSLSVSGD